MTDDRIPLTTEEIMLIRQLAGDRVDALIASLGLDVAAAGAQL